MPMREMAETLGVTRQAVEQWEHRRAHPKPMMAAAICRMARDRGYPMDLETVYEVTV